MKKLIAIITNVGLLLGLGVLSFFTQELVTFVMLGIIIIMLSDIYYNFDDIYKE